MRRRILHYIPEKEEGLVLFTTRNAEEGQAIANPGIVQLDEMDRHER